MNDIPVIFRSTFDLKVVMSHEIMGKLIDLVLEVNQECDKVVSAEVFAEYDEDGPFYGSLFIHFVDGQGNLVYREEMEF